MEIRRPGREAHNSPTEPRLGMSGAIARYHTPFLRGHGQPWLIFYFIIESYFNDDVSAAWYMKMAAGRAISPGLAQWLRCCVTNRKVAGSIPAGVSGFFIDIKSFRSQYGPRVDLASNRNESGVFPGRKSRRCARLTTLPPFCTVITKSGNLNFLRTLWACAVL